MDIESIVTLQFPADRQALMISRMMQVTAGVNANMKPRQASNFQMYYLTLGEMSISLDGKTENLAEGCFRIVHPGQAFGIERCPKGVSFYHCHFEAGTAAVSYTHSRLREWACLISRMNEGAAGYARSLHLPDRITIADRAAATDMCVQLMRRQRERRHGFELAYQATFMLLLQHLSELAVRKLAEARDSISLSAPEVHLTRSFDLIEQWLGRNISLYDIARELDLNAAYLSRIFKAYAGTTVGEYILRRKITMAKGRLLSTRLNVKQVAASVGFKDQGYFCRKFRRTTGMSPREYLLRHLA